MRSPEGAGGGEGTAPPTSAPRSGRGESPRMPAGAAEEPEDKRPEAGAPQAPPSKLVASFAPLPVLPAWKKNGSFCILTPSKPGHLRIAALLHSVAQIPLGAGLSRGLGDLGWGGNVPSLVFLLPSGLVDVPTPRRCDRGGRGVSLCPLAPLPAPKGMGKKEGPVSHIPPGRGPLSRRCGFTHSSEALLSCVLSDHQGCREVFGLVNVVELRETQIETSKFWGSRYK